ncbi:MAG: hypothetical protein IT319_02050 [Anaerolineae bacterium]|nr:hypothetical protein [Anaerolineae bacterium]
MKADAFNQLIILFGWFLLVGLILFLMLIARFYQRFAGEKTYYQLFLIPMMLFGVQVVRRTNFSHDPFGNLSAALGGVMLLALSLFLYRRMTKGRGT